MCCVQLKVHVCFFMSECRVRHDCFPTGRVLGNGDTQAGTDPESGCEHERGTCE